MATRHLCLAVLLAATVAQAGDAWHVPARGTPERKQIMDALRAYMKQFDAQPQVFVVRELCVGPDRGWISVDPQSPDGLSHYESLNAVLERHGRSWRVRELACGEEECPAGTSPDELRARVAPHCL